MINPIGANMIDEIRIQGELVRCEVIAGREQTPSKVVVSGANKPALIAWLGGRGEPGGYPPAGVIGAVVFRCCWCW